MFINKTKDGKNNLCGPWITALRKQQRLSQRALAERLQIEGLDLDEMQLRGLDLDKNAIQRIESGQRFVTDIELCVFCRFFHIRADVLLGLEEWEEKI